MDSEAPPPAKKPKKPSRPSHKAYTESRIECIVDMMLAPGAWTPGESVARLARRWKVSPSRVQGLAAEAARRAYQRLTDREPTTVEITAALRWGMGEAVRQKDLGAIPKIGKVWADIVGVTATRRYRMETEQAQAPMTPSEEIALLEARLAQLKGSQT